ncbi:translation termination inhibitor protein itt1 [Agyrium rufum]|nr:translation termination inhibitor protein itt1 [Agyrium rufum]
MDGDLGENQDDDERSVELQSVQATFPELMIDPRNPFAASISLPVHTIEPLPILFPALVDGAAATKGQSLWDLAEAQRRRTTTLVEEEAQAVLARRNIKYLSFLPPLKLEVSLPKGYPEEKSPALKLSSELSWLPETKVQELVAKGRALWESVGHSFVVFDYIDSLVDAASNGFDLVTGAEEALELPQNLELELLDYDLKAKRAKFEKETFECGICLEPKKGSVCHRLMLCGHVFCVACLQDFYNSCILEGDISQVKCLDPGCGKEANGTAQIQISNTKKRKKKRKDRTLDPSELLQIPIPEETVQRYIKLKRKKKLESDRTTVYCPRQWCQGPAKPNRSSKTANISLDSDSEDEDAPPPPPPVYDPNANESTLPPPSERLAVCEDCSFAFCRVCKTGWHGEFARCFPRRQYELTAEEKASEDYMKKHSTACPTCDARCQKTMGCNHMICFKCETHFCYLCSSWLSETNPYIHFNTEDTECYMKLWELEEGDGEGANRVVPPVVAAAAPRGQDRPEVIVLHVPGPAPAPAPALAHVPPPPAPEPPQVRRIPPAPPQVALEVPNGVRVNARVREGLARPRQLPPVRGRGPPVQGLQRFLQLVENDDEDEWDSDEMDDLEEQAELWHIAQR